jgi:hypothetical protein
MLSALDAIAISGANDPAKSRLLVETGQSFGEPLILDLCSLSCGDSSDEEIKPAPVSEVTNNGLSPFPTR